MAANIFYTGHGAASVRKQTPEEYLFQKILEYGPWQLAYNGLVKHALNHDFVLNDQNLKKFINLRDWRSRFNYIYAGDRIFIIWVENVKPKLRDSHAVTGEWTHQIKVIASLFPFLEEYLEKLKNISITHAEFGDIFEHRHLFPDTLPVDNYGRCLKNGESIDLTCTFMEGGSPSMNTKFGVYSALLPDFNLGKSAEFVTDPANYLLNADTRRCDLGALPPSLLTDHTLGHWDLWWPENSRAPEQYYQPVELEGKFIARNPVQDITNDPVAIDFGTTSTVVASRTKGKTRLLRMGEGAGTENLEKPVNPFENPTVLLFDNYPNLLATWREEPFRPTISWMDAQCSHQALEDGKSRVPACMRWLKTWARARPDARPLILVDGDGNEIRFSTASDNAGIAIEKDFAAKPLDPIELYAFYLGLHLNNQLMDGGRIHTNYYMTFPVMFEQEVKNRILASFRRGIVRSLPPSLVYGCNFDVNRITVRERANEPAAFAAAALKEVGRRDADIQDSVAPSPAEATQEADIHRQKNTKQTSANFSPDKFEDIMNDLRKYYKIARNMGGQDAADTETRGSDFAILKEMGWTGSDPVAKRAVANIDEIHEVAARTSILHPIQIGFFEDIKLYYTQRPYMGMSREYLKAIKEASPNTTLSFSSFYTPVKIRELGPRCHAILRMAETIQELRDMLNRTREPETSPAPPAPTPRPSIVHRNLDQATVEKTLTPTPEGLPFGVFDFGGGTTDFAIGLYRLPTEKEELEEGWEEVVDILASSGDPELGGERLVELMAFEAICANRQTLQGKNVFFVKPANVSHVPGTEKLFFPGANARANTVKLMEALRPLWEADGAISGGQKEFVFLNEKGEEGDKISLKIDEKALKALLKTKIAKAVDEFFVLFGQAFQESGIIPHEFHILLAGNSCRSPLVTECFREKIEQLLKLGDEQVKDEIVVHPPLYPTSANPEAVSMKTGVALGLLNMLPGEPMGVVIRKADRMEAPFPFTVGPIVRGLLKPVLKRDAPYNKWQELGICTRHGSLLLGYSQSPLAIEGMCARGDCGEKMVEFGEGHMGKKIMICATSPTSVRIGLKNDRGKVEGEQEIWLQ